MKPIYNKNRRKKKLIYKMNAINKKLKYLKQNM